MYYFGTGCNVPAIARKILEVDLMEQYHWLPHEIDRIPYKRMQEFLLIRKQKNFNIQSKVNIEKAKSQHMSSGSGQMKKFTREV